MTQEEIQTTLLKLLKDGAVILGELVYPTANNSLRKAVKSRTGNRF
jgi:hypothetical protein